MNIDESIFDTVDAPFEPESMCDHLMSTITIRENGDIVPCCYDLTSVYVASNILNENILDIWYGEKMQKIRDTFAAREFISLCQTCLSAGKGSYLVRKN